MCEHISALLKHLKIRPINVTIVCFASIFTRRLRRSSAAVQAIFSLSVFVSEYESQKCFALSQLYYRRLSALSHRVDRSLAGSISRSAVTAAAAVSDHRAIFDILADG